MQQLIGKEIPEISLEDVEGWSDEEAAKARKGRRRAGARSPRSSDKAARQKTRGPEKGKSRKRNEGRRNRGHGRKLQTETAAPPQRRPRRRTRTLKRSLHADEILRRPHSGFYFAVGGVTRAPYSVFWLSIKPNVTILADTNRHTPNPSFNRKVEIRGCDENAGFTQGRDHSHRRIGQSPDDNPVGACLHGAAQYTRRDVRARQPARSPSASRRAQ